MRTTPTKALLAALVLSGGCEFLDSDSDELADTSDESGESGTDGGEPLPIEGFRVFPKFMLQDVAAIVTIETAGLPAEPCVLDDAPEGGYLCDAEDLPGTVATIRVEKDGFDSAVRNPEIQAYAITPLEVHLAAWGGPTGTWSACTAAGEFQTCAELCAAEQLGCAVTSCATESVDSPIATFETFTGPNCDLVLESLAAACDQSLPLAGQAESLRCCCA